MKLQMLAVADAAPRKFISQPKKIMVNEGDTIKLPCTVDKLDEFMIMWKKGSRIIALGENFMEPDPR